MDASWINIYSMVNVLNNYLLFHLFIIGRTVEFQRFSFSDCCSHHWFIIVIINIIIAIVAVVVIYWWRVCQNRPRVSFFFFFCLNFCYFAWFFEWNEAMEVWWTWLDFIDRSISKFRYRLSGLLSSTLLSVDSFLSLLKDKHKVLFCLLMDWFDISWREKWFVCRPVELWWLFAVWFVCRVSGEIFVGRVDRWRWVAAAHLPPNSISR